ncbi:MAG: hypothetical protein AAB593_00420 [Patescibacteria group bacterium]
MKKIIYKGVRIVNYEFIKSMLVKYKLTKIKADAHMVLGECYFRRLENEIGEDFITIDFSDDYPYLVVKVTKLFEENNIYYIELESFNNENKLSTHEVYSNCFYFELFLKSLALSKAFNNKYFTPEKAFYCILWCGVRDNFEIPLTLILILV